MSADIVSLAMPSCFHRPKSATWSRAEIIAAPLPAGASPVQVLSHRLQTRAGRVLYAWRKQTVEPLFGLIESVLGFRQFSLHGLAKVTGEWTLLCLA